MGLRILFYITVILFFTITSLTSCNRDVQYTTQSAAHTYSPYKNMKYDKVTVKEKKPMSKRK